MNTAVIIFIGIVIYIIVNLFKYTRKQSRYHHQRGYRHTPNRRTHYGFSDRGSMNDGMNYGSFDHTIHSSQHDFNHDHDYNDWNSSDSSSSDWGSSSSGDWGSSDSGSSSDSGGGSSEGSW